MPRPSIHERLTTAAAEREMRSTVRVRRTVTSRAGACVVVDGRALLNFCSNDYLGLADHPVIVAALCEAASKHGAGATASHLVCGHHALHEAVERELSDWLGWPRALLFGAGYSANLGVLQALLGTNDLCVQDHLNHASLLDGARLAGCALKRYPHGDAEGARRHLRARPAAAAMLATDGVFSMDGDLAPLRALAEIARDENALLYVDDAHGVGVLGEDGRGSVAAAGLSAREVPLLLVTLGKALGGYGAAVLGDATLIEHLAHSCRAYLYTTALPPAQAAATLAAIRIVRAEAWRREKLQSLIARFRRGAAQLGLPLMASPTPIQPIVLGGNACALAASRALEAQGLWVSAIRPPSVPQGRARLRVTLSAMHEETEVDALLAALAGAVRAQT